MSLKYGKSEIAAMAAVLDGDYSTVEEAAAAALLAAEEIFEKRAQFVVVGQLAATLEDGEIPPSDPRAIKLALGWYSTEGDARSASESLWHSAASGDTFRYWVLPTFHGTPAELHSKRKEQYAAKAEKAKEASRERLRAEIAKRDAEQQERANGGKGSCEHCGHIRGEHGIDTKGGYGPCKLPQCKGICDVKFKERTKAIAA